MLMLLLISNIDGHRGLISHVFFFQIGWYRRCCQTCPVTTSFGNPPLRIRHALAKTMGLQLLR